METKAPAVQGKTLNSKHTTAVSTGLIWTAVHHRTCCPLFTWSVLSLPNKLWPERQMGVEVRPLFAILPDGETAREKERETKSKSKRERAGKRTIGPRVIKSTE